MNPEGVRMLSDEGWPAVAEVDELAAIPLTLWAEENGYSKLAERVLGL